MDQLQLLSDLKVLEGRLLQNEILLRWVKENLDAFSPSEKHRVSKLLETSMTALRGSVEDTKEST